MKKQMILCMGILLLLCWYVGINGFIRKDSKYQEAVRQAKELEAKEIYIKAIDAYEEALTYKNADYVAMYGIAADYMLLDETDKYAEQMWKLIDALGVKEESVQELYDYYMGNDRINDADELAYKLYHKYPENELVIKLYEERKGDYSELYNSYEKIYPYNEEYAVYEFQGKKGLIDGVGRIVIEAKYDEISYPVKDEIAVTDGERAYYINLDGYKIAEPDGKYDYLSSFSSGCVLARKGSRYGYLNSDYKEITDFSWEEATKIYDKLGAVKRDGKWALINEKQELISDYIYEDVKYDIWKRCSMNQVVWVKKNGYYQLMNAEGNVLTENKYEDVKPFATTQPCAVMKNGKWGFVDLSGKEVIACQYEDAESFSKDFAPVADHSLWGMIDLNGKKIIDYTFDSLLPINADGAAPFQREDSWSLLKMKIYD